MTFAVIFDMDGVLIDSTIAIQAIIKKVSMEYGLDLSPEEVLESTHLPFQVYVENWNAQHNRTIDAREVIQKYEVKEKEYLKTHSLLTNGILPFLNDLRANNVLLAVATSSPRSRLNSILSMYALSPFFDVTISIDDVSRGKPHPDPYLKAAELLKILPSHCVGIEDTLTGINSVLSAGMKAIGFAQNGESRKALASADLVIGNFSELSVEKLSKLVH
ncbi:MAG: HAD family phosphatase [Candidatus Diapherotrites archaeon]